MILCDNVFVVVSFDLFITSVTNEERWDAHMPLSTRDRGFARPAFDHLATDVRDQTTTRLRSWTTVPSQYVYKDHCAAVSTSHLHTATSPRSDVPSIPWSWTTYCLLWSVSIVHLSFIQIIIRANTMFKLFKMCVICLFHKTKTSYKLKLRTHLLQLVNSLNICCEYTPPPQWLFHRLFNFTCY